MLSRTANELYWMARHIERAENTARLLDVTYRTSLLPYDVAASRASRGPSRGRCRSSRPALATAYYETLPGALRRERAALHDPRRRQPVVDLLLPARGARIGAHRARRDHLGDVRGPERAWLEMRGYDYERVAAHRRLGVLDWVKMRSHLFRGVTFGTMLRDEAYHFIRLGTHLERADNTARILDAKYHILLPSAADVGGAVDYYQWASLLHSVSGFESYRKIYSDVITPRRVAELLILRDDMPRSLHACMNLIDETLRAPVRRAQPGARAAWRASCTRGCTTAAPRTSSRFGLHEYLMDFLERISALGDEISGSLPGPDLLTRNRAPLNAHLSSARIIGLGFNAPS